MPDMLLYSSIILNRNNQTVYTETLRMLERFIVTEWLSCEKQERLPQNINETKYKLIQDAVKQISRRSFVLSFPDVHIRDFIEN